MVLEDTAHHVGEGWHPQVDGRRGSTIRKHSEMKAPLPLSVWDSVGWRVFLSQLNLSGDTLMHTHRGVFLDGSKSSQLASEYELSYPSLVLTEHHPPAQVICLCS